MSTASWRRQRSRSRASVRSPLQRRGHPDSRSGRRSGGTAESPYSKRVEHPRRAAARPERPRRRGTGRAVRAAHSAEGTGGQDPLCASSPGRQPPRAEFAVETRSNRCSARRPGVRAGLLEALDADPRPLSGAAFTRGHPSTEVPAARAAVASDRPGHRCRNPGLAGAGRPGAAVDDRGAAQRARSSSTHLASGNARLCDRLSKGVRSRP